jgi:ubiquinone/menaquinone biosynthesis C-methylase UbiE
MKINYKETTTDLQTRIDIHNQFGGRNIDQWMLQLLALKQGSKILDVGCGSGKQCFSFFNELGGDCDITGGDVSTELLAQARQANAQTANRISFIDLNFNERFPLDENAFDLVSCCFAIYYAENVPFTIGEMHRVLKPGGKLFTTGPMPENKRLFYDIIRDATQKPIPPMPGSSRFSTEFLSVIREKFASVEVHIFENPLTFPEVQPFVDYTRASLSEDRKLWSTFFDDKEDFEQIMARIAEAAKRRLEKDGSLVMTKVVGGILATK